MLISRRPVSPLLPCSPAAGWWMLAQPQKPRLRLPPHRPMRYPPAAGEVRDTTVRKAAPRGYRSHAATGAARCGGAGRDDAARCGRHHGRRSAVVRSTGGGRSRSRDGDGGVVIRDRAFARPRSAGSPGGRGQRRGRRAPTRPTASPRSDARPPRIGRFGTDRPGRSRPRYPDPPEERSGPRWPRTPCTHCPLGDCGSP